MSLMIRLFLADLPDLIAVRLAYLLPHRVVKWAAVRLIAHASFVLSDTEMDAITPADALKAWDKYPEDLQ